MLRLIIFALRISDITNGLSYCYSIVSIARRIYYNDKKEVSLISFKNKILIHSHAHKV